MKVRAIVRLGLLAAIIAAAGILMGCGGRQKSLPKSSSMTVSIVDRLSIFVSSLNGDRSDTSSNLDPGISTYSTADAAFWNSQFPSSRAPYSFTPSLPDTALPSDVEITIKGTRYSFLFQFVMVNIGKGSDNWVIHGMQKPPGKPVF